MAWITLHRLDQRLERGLGPTRAQVRHAGQEQQIGLLRRALDRKSVV